MLRESLSLCTYPSLLPIFHWILPLLSPFKPNLAHAEHRWCTTRRVCKGCFSKDLLHCLAVMHHSFAKMIHHVLPCLPPISHLPSPCSSSFSLFPPLPCTPRRVLPAGAVRVKHSCVPDTHPTACERLTPRGMCSMWPRCSCHPLHFLMRFLPLLIKVTDLSYGGGKAMGGR